MQSPASNPVNLSLRETREVIGRDVVTCALRKHSGKIALAAAELGGSRPTLYELTEKLGITKAEADKAG